MKGTYFLFFFLLLPSSFFLSHPVFGQKSGQFCTRYNGTRCRGRCKFRNVGSLATCSRCIPAVFSRHPNRALSRVVGLSAFAWMRYLCIGLFSATLPLRRSLSVQPPARPPHPSLSRAHYLSRSTVLSSLPPLPRITANNECIRNPTFLCPSVARFFVS